MTSPSSTWQRIYAGLRRASDWVGRKRSVRITQIGYMAVFLIVLIGAAAFNTGTNLLYLMLATLLSFCALSVLTFSFNLARVTVRRRLPLEIFAEQPTEIEYSLSNRKRLSAAYGILIQEQIRTPLPLRIASFALIIGPRRTSSYKSMVAFARRGWWDLRDIQLISSFPFGLIENRVTRKVPLKVLVFPRLMPIESFLKEQAIDFGTQEALAKGHGSSLYGIRDYAPGDSARMIDWKLSAKGVGVKVREYEREDARRVRLIFAPQLPRRLSLSERDLDLFEDWISLAGSLARYFISLKFEVALWSPIGSLPSGTGEKHLHGILRSLAVTEARDFLKVPPSVRPPSSLEFNDLWVCGKIEDDRKLEKSALGQPK